MLNTTELLERILEELPADDLWFSAVFVCRGFHHIISNSLQLQRCLFKIPDDNGPPSSPLTILALPGMNVHNHNAEEGDDEFIGTIRVDIDDLNRKYFNSITIYLEWFHSRLDSNIDSRIRDMLVTRPTTHRLVAYGELVDPSDGPKVWKITPFCVLERGEGITIGNVMDWRKQRIGPDDKA